MQLRFTPSPKFGLSVKLGYLSAPRPTFGTAPAFKNES
mgnify:CR=1 FL=1|jgi:hypothetical protein